MHDLSVRVISLENTMRALAQDFAKIKDNYETAHAQLAQNLNDNAAFMTRWDAWSGNIEKVATNVTITMSAHEKINSDHDKRLNDIEAYIRSHIDETVRSGDTVFANSATV